MALASSHHTSFLSNTGLPPTAYSPKKKKMMMKLTPSLSSISCSSSPLDGKHTDYPSRKNELRLEKLAVVVLAAGVLTMGSVNEAMAAKTGGRVGGQAFRSSAPRPSSPRINNSRTNIYVNPRVAPPLVGGYGYGLPFYGGWGWSPFSFFAPGPSVAIGVGGGFDFFSLFLVLGLVATVIRGFSRRRDEEDDDY